MKTIKTLWPILLSLIVVLTALYIVRNNFTYEGMATDLSSWGVFFTVFGVLYAILVGFLILEVLQRFSSLSQVIEEELNAVEDIRDFLMYLDGNETVIKDIKSSLLVYINSVIDKEWDEMADTSKKTDSDTSKELYGLMESIHKINPGNESDKIALEALIGKVSEITTLRTRRIAIADEKLPPRLKMLILFMSFILILGFILMGVNNVWIHGIMVFSIMASIHLIYMVISDLDNPFYGVWNVDKKPFLELKQKLKKIK